MRTFAGNGGAGFFSTGRILEITGAFFLAGVGAFAGTLGEDLAGVVTAIFLSTDFLATGLTALAPLALAGFFSEKS
ncbi:MAG: hypothetical protein RSB24_00610 [Akkermansia sp.]